MLSYVDRLSAIIEIPAAALADAHCALERIGPAGPYSDGLQEVTKQHGSSENIRRFDIRYVGGTWVDRMTSVRYPYDVPEPGIIVVLIHDEFKDLTFWTDFIQSPEFECVAMDTHIYRMLSDTVCS
ncbi:hypothetical protein IW261DRAFT_1602743 [Armillaria novae-zelandiae]|uniref:Uncharacterized protein n=1 Tax=Armillaria novae-zelandiae TaxID=153914 RepID=A0AA39UIG2_9AGAR|nr:hypothetical protein IW261DRAFT_1602743 [Armillaria novae-zelandiae]